MPESFEVLLKIQNVALPFSKTIRKNNLSAKRKDGPFEEIFVLNYNISLYLFSYILGKNVPVFVLFCAKAKNFSTQNFCEEVRSQVFSNTQHEVECKRKTLRNYGRKSLKLFFFTL